MMDLLLELWVSGLIELSKIEWMFGAGRPWQPGERLRLLFAGYNGSRNTGSDVRVEEILRQVRRVLGESNVELSVMTQNFDFTRGYFGDARQVKLPDVYPPFLFREVPRHHGVVACEGSMFKSKFANALTTMMVGSLGIAAARNRLSVGYGGDAGKMDRALAWSVSRYCSHSYIIARSEESRELLAKLNVPAEVGTDTAWTFEPQPPDYGRKALTDAGWDGKKPILVICPIQPFIWPVKASIGKYLARKLSGVYEDSQYRTIYFFRSGREVNAAFDRYLGAIARSVRLFAERHGAFPVCVASERLDADPCRLLAERLGGAPVFTSDEHNMFQLVSVLRCAAWMISSRYHGIVTAMPALVPSAGITMDERIRNLMHERGHEELLLEVDDPDLEVKLGEVLETLACDADRFRDGIGRTVARNLKSMARMGVCFEEQVQRRYPEFPVRQGVASWEDYLPPLSAGLRRLLETYGG
ncbi:MAG TPA: polysaccharide pyruvyl transferase family protein [Candidatus Acidoferrales bacterium]|nr:polysaccharide pyruvyl transferase family protein [Candidatus Acidoferrales bacterium]